MTEDPGDFTILLNEARSGVPGAGDRLESLVYKKLRRLAAARLRRERHAHTLTPTALANEAWLRFSPNVRLEDVANQRHLCGIAGRSMRRILVEHARARNADKRGGQWERVPLESVDLSEHQSIDVLALNEALEQFEAVHPRAAKAVELKFFVGCTLDEIATMIGVQRRTVDRDLAFARAWIFGRMRQLPSTEAR
jgi:RNA polymerase sigma factor (TIGR02999 family)